MEREMARVFQGHFSVPLSFNSTVLLLLMSLMENFKRSFKQKDPIANAQGRQSPFEKGLRCLKHIIHVFEKTHSIYFKTLRY